jgi:hypothetical protein
MLALYIDTNNFTMQYQNHRSLFPSEEVLSVANRLALRGKYETGPNFHYQSSLSTTIVSLIDKLFGR